MNKINVYVYDNKMLHLFEGESTSKNTRTNKTFISCNKKTKDKKFHTSEDKFIYESLKNADPNEYTLVCLDKLNTLCSARKLYDYLEYTIDNIIFDIFYLSVWADRCDKYTDIHEVENCKIVKTFSPHGTACLLFSPSGRKIFLENIIPSPNISIDFTLNSKCSIFKSYTSLPALVEFDCLSIKGDKKREMIKMSRYREDPYDLRPIEVTRRNTSTLNVFWFILIVIIIICVAGILLSINTNKNYLDKKLSYPAYPYDIEGTLIQR